MLSFIDKTVNFFTKNQVLGSLLAIGLFLLVIAIMLLWPFAIIWALNTLFPALAINYGFFQWLAIAVLNLSWFSRFKAEQHAS